MSFNKIDCNTRENTLQLYEYPFSYQLQFFASGNSGDKTEKATPKKLEEARKEGRVAKSVDLINGFMLLILFVILKLFGNFMSDFFSKSFVKFYNQTPVYSSEIFDVSKAMILGREIIIDIVLISAPIMLAGFVIAFIGNIAQVGWKITGKPLKPKLERINPISGAKRLFSKDKIVELIKAVAKILAIGLVSYNAVKDKWKFLLNLYDYEFMQAILNILEIVIDVGIRISVVFVIIGVFDFAYQKWKYLHDLKMTKQEVKDEYKQMEGDPQVKGRIKQKMREASRRRMMQELPKADVVITNPTHFAVAIQYDKETMEAPVVIAKGADYVAQNIKEAAREHNIEIVENKPLARILYHNVPIGEQVPTELYEMVAQVLVYVYNIKNKIVS